MSHKEILTKFVKEIYGRPVVVKLNSGVDFRGMYFHKFLNLASLSCKIFAIWFLGVLECLDGYLNIVLDQTEEHKHGQLMNKYGDVFIRGNNVLYISAKKIRR